MKVLFFSTPAFGHINATIPIIEKLVKADYEVICYSTEKFKKMIEDTGATYIKYQIDFNENKLVQYTSNLVELFRALIDLNHEAFEYYIKKINYNEVDLIIYDSMCSFAKNIAIKNNKKYICIQTTMAYNIFVFIFSNLFWKSLKVFLKNINTILKEIKKEKIFRRKHNLSKLSIIDLFVNSGDKTIVLSPKELQPFYRTFNKNFCFVGTTIKERLKKQTAQYEQYDYFVSLGSIWKADNNILENLKNFPNKKIVILSTKKINSKNISTYKFVEQLALLKNVNIFINHGGLNSVYESIYLNKKQVMVPIQEEERLTALIMESKKIGAYSKNYDEINKKIDNINKWTKNLEKYSYIIRSYDGTELAFEIIEKYIKKR